jgi:hypothetical protein
VAFIVVALRGVCIGPGQHLLPGQRATLDAATYQFLHSIGAVQAAPPDPAPSPAPVPAPLLQPVAPAKPARRET